MIVFLLGALLIIAGTSLPATKSIKNYKTLNKWDYIYPYTGIRFYTPVDFFDVIKILNNFFNFPIFVFPLNYFWISGLFF